MAKKKNMQKFNISVSWRGKNQEYMYLSFRKDEFNYRLNCKNFQDFVKLLQEARDTQKSVSIGKMAVDKLNENEVKTLQHHGVQVAPCYFCKKGNPIYVVSPDIREAGYLRDQFSLCKKHLIELTRQLEVLEEEGSYKVTTPYTLEVITYEDEDTQE